MGDSSGRFTPAPPPPPAYDVASGYVNDGPLAFLDVGRLQKKPPRIFIIAPLPLSGMAIGFDGGCGLPRPPGPSPLPPTGSSKPGGAGACPTEIHIANANAYAKHVQGQMAQTI